MVEKRIDELIKRLNKANYEYYSLDNPSITDQEYDDMMDELISLETNNPSLVRNDLPTLKVGGEVVSGFNKVTHEVPMMSLADVFNIDEIRNFFKKRSNKTYEFVSSIDHQMKKYLSGLVIVMLISVIEYSFVYSLIGHPDALLLGLLAGFTNLIPYFGGIMNNCIAAVTAFKFYKDDIFISIKNSKKKFQPNS